MTTINSSIGNQEKIAFSKQKAEYHDSTAAKFISGSCHTLAGAALLIAALALPIFALSCLAAATYFCWPVIFASVLLIPASAVGTYIVFKMAREQFTQAVSDFSDMRKA